MAAKTKAMIGSAATDHLPDQRRFLKIRQRRRILKPLLFNVNFFLLYWLTNLVDRILPRRKKPLPDGPLPVYRMTTSLTQGGVAKVCLQTLLASDPRDVTWHMNIFGPFCAVPEVLSNRTEMTFRSRKTTLLSSSYRPAVIKNIFRTARRIRKSGARIVHLHEPQYTPAVRIACILAGRLPLVVHLHNDYNSRWSYQKPSSLHDKLIRHSVRNSYALACSRTIRESSAQWLDIPIEQIRLIEDGADDCVTPHPETVSADLLRAANGRRIITKMAHIIAHKRLEDFMAACRVLLDEGENIFVLLMAYGKPEARRALRRRFETLFAPWEGQLMLHVSDPQSLLPHVGVGVSASSLEGLGLNILEYQMAGVPVVCTDLQPHREMVEDGVNGLLYETGNVPELVKQVREVLGDPELASRLAKNGKETASRRTWKKTAEKTVAFYREILG